MAADCGRGRCHWRRGEHHHGSWHCCVERHDDPRDRCRLRTGGELEDRCWRHTLAAAVLELVTGDSATAGATGDVSITTGDATGGNGGDITLTVGEGDTGNGGAMTLTAGKTTAAAAVGGAVTLTAGQATDGTGGDLVLTSGEGTTASGAVSCEFRGCNRHNR